MFKRIISSNKTVDEKEEKKYCKKCGEEISSYNKKGICENCREQRNGKLKKIGIGSAAVVFLGLNQKYHLDDKIKDISSLVKK